jgi:Tfp pilus assembly protein PilZ
VEIFASVELAVNSFSEDKVIEKIKKMQLRRRFKRLPIDIKIELKEKYARTPQCLKLDILNLSAIGAYIYGCDKFKLGDEVVLRLNLPPKNEEIELEAKVVWLPDKQVQQRIYPGMGVEFENVSDSVQHKIIDFIERNLSFMASDQ